MSAELTIGAFIAKFWGVIATFGLFIISHIRLNSKVDSQEKRVDRLEAGLLTALHDLKIEVKETNNKLDEVNKNTTNLIIKGLENHHK